MNPIEIEMLKEQNRFLTISLQDELDRGTLLMQTSYRNGRCVGIGIGWILGLLTMAGVMFYL